MPTRSTDEKQPASRSRTPTSPARRRKGSEVPADSKAAKESADSTAPDSPPPPLDLPFDAGFFRAQFVRLIGAPPATAVRAAGEPDFQVTLVIGDGMVQFDVAYIEQIELHWMLVALREDERGGTPARYVFVPFASIARVEVTASHRLVRPIGFGMRRIAAPAADAVAYRSVEGQDASKSLPAASTRRRRSRKAASGKAPRRSAKPRRVARPKDPTPRKAVKRKAAAGKAPRRSAKPHKAGRPQDPAPSKAVKRKSKPRRPRKPVRKTAR